MRRASASSLNSGLHRAASSWTTARNGSETWALSRELFPFSCHLGESACAPPLPSVSGHVLVFFGVLPVWGRSLPALGPLPGSLTSRDEPILKAATTWSLTSVNQQCEPMTASLYMSHFLVGRVHFGVHLWVCTEPHSWSLMYDALICQFPQSHPPPSKTGVNISVTICSRLWGQQPS